MNTSLLSLACGLALTALPAAAAAPAASAPGVERPSIMQVQDLAHRHDVLALSPATAAPPARTGGPRYLYNGGGLTHEVLGFATYWELADGNLSDVQWDKVSTVAYFGLTVNGSGGFDNDAGMTGWNSSALTSMIATAHGAGDHVELVAKQFSDASINSIVSNPSTGQTAITNIINAVKSKNLDGVNIDFEGSTSSSYPNIQTDFTNWVASLYTQLHAAVSGSMLTLDSYSGAASWNNGFMRIDTLAPHVDAFFIMAYDMGLSNASAMGLPGTLPNAPLAGNYTYYDSLSVSQYLSKVNGDGSKVILGVPYYGYKFSTTNTSFNAPTSSGATADVYSDARADLACAEQLTQNWDGPSSTPWASWWSPATNDPCGGNHNSWRELYYDDANSLGAKYDLVVQRNIRGTGMWALGFDHGYPDLWRVIRDKFQLWPGWSSLAGVAKSIAVASNSDGRLELFAVNSGNALWHRWQTSPAGPWSQWVELGGSISQPPAVGVNADGRLEVFVVNDGGGLWHIWQDAPGSSAWSAWSSLGGSISRPPAVARNADGRLQVFVVNGGGGLWSIAQAAPNGIWSGWVPLGGAIAQAPAVGSNADGRLEVFVVNPAGVLWHRWQLSPGGAWADWSSLGGSIAQAPSVTANADGRLEAFVVNDGAALYHRWQTSPNGLWSDWASLGGSIGQAPAAGSSGDGRVRAFVVNTGNGVWSRAQAQPGSAAWADWVGLAGATNLPPVAARSADGHLQVFVIDADGTIWTQ